jgi:hypothetical protein
MSTINVMPLLPVMSMFTSVVMRTVMHDMIDVLDNCQVNIREILSVSVIVCNCCHELHDCHELHRSHVLHD